MPTSAEGTTALANSRAVAFGQITNSKNNTPAAHAAAANFGFIVRVVNSDSGETPFASKSACFVRTDNNCPDPSPCASGCDSSSTTVESRSSISRWFCSISSAMRAGVNGDASGRTSAKYAVTHVANTPHPHMTQRGPAVNIIVMASTAIIKSTDIRAAANTASSPRARTMEMMRLRAWLSMEAISGGSASKALEGGTNFSSFFNIFRPKSITIFFALPDALILRNSMALPHNPFRSEQPYYGRIKYPRVPQRLLRAFDHDAVALAK